MSYPAFNRYYEDTKTAFVHLSRLRIPLGRFVSNDASCFMSTPEPLPRSAMPGRSPIHSETSITTGAGTAHYIATEAGELIAGVQGVFNAGMQLDFVC